MLAPKVIPVFHLPVGTKNLKTLIPGIDWNKFSDYSVELLDGDGAVILETNKMTLGCCCSSDKVRIHFRNALGAMDAVNFNPPVIIQETNSKDFKTPLPANFTKTDAGAERFNVSTTETYECSTSCYQESDMAWLMELKDSSKAFIEWAGIEGQADSYLPIRILDGKYDRKKNENEFFYTFRIQFRIANDIITIRG